MQLIIDRFALKTLNAKLVPYPIFVTFFFRAARIYTTTFSAQNVSEKKSLRRN